MTTPAAAWPPPLTWRDVAQAHYDGWQDRGSYDVNCIPDPRDAGLTAEDFYRASEVLGDPRFAVVAARIEALTMTAGEGR